MPYNFKWKFKLLKCQRVSQHKELVSFSGGTFDNLGVMSNFDVYEANFRLQLKNPKFPKTSKDTIEPFSLF